MARRREHGLRLGRVRREHVGETEALRPGGAGRIERVAVVPAERAWQVGLRPPRRDRRASGRREHDDERHAERGAAPIRPSPTADHPLRLNSSNRDSASENGSSRSRRPSTIPSRSPNPAGSRPSSRIDDASARATMRPPAQADHTDASSGRRHAGISVVARSTQRSVHERTSKYRVHATPLASRCAR